MDMGADMRAMGAARVSVQRAFGGPQRLVRLPGAIFADLTFAAARAEPPLATVRSWRRTAGLSPP